eukprot:TRINITY_DN2546_c0_g1_i24.p1 TRINITY_DN2546_c0_g1~~TRINITY_DN2546_c0_g1_i24.p1  ORF type:complete len:505 (-),score=79.45 TRINITY_DN2546_c0_g1_i24:660-2174(-)
MSAFTTMTWALLLWWLVSLSQGNNTQDFVKVGFIYLGPISDFGWNFAHDQGRVFIQDVAFPGQVFADYIENVAETDNTTIDEQVHKWTNEGFHLIIGTSFSFQYRLFDLARWSFESGNNTKFVSVTGFLRSENLMTASARIYQARYIVGRLGARMTKTKEFCYIAAFRENSEVTTGINAFTIGLREILPDAKVYVYYTNSWLNDTIEDKAARTCYADHPNADIYTQHTDGLSVQKVAKELGKWAIGYDSDMRIFIGELVLSSPIFNWGPLYKEIMERIFNDTWIENADLWPGIAEGAVNIASFSNRVPANTTEEILQIKREFLTGKRKDVFCSPLVANGSIGIVNSDGCLDDLALITMHNLTEGVVDEGVVIIPPPEEVWLHWNSPVAIAFMCAAALGIIFSFFLIMLLLFWDNPHFKASSIEFLVVINIGTILGLASVFLLIGDPNAAQCQTFLWIIGTAFIVCYGSFFPHSPHLNLTLLPSSPPSPSNKKMKKGETDPLFQQ